MKDMEQRISLNVNGRKVEVGVADPAMPLLYALRNDLGLHGPRFGCRLSQCGACTVHLDGNAVRSCVLPIASVAGRNIVTLEGLGTPDKPHSLQQRAARRAQSEARSRNVRGPIQQASTSDPTGTLLPLAPVMSFSGPDPFHKQHHPGSL